MHIGGFNFLSRTSSKRTFTVASWHNPKSLTWRWLLHVSFGGWYRHVRIGLYRHENNSGQLIGLNLPFVSFHFQTQRPMWLADIERRKAEQARV